MELTPELAPKIVKFVHLYCPEMEVNEAIVLVDNALVTDSKELFSDGVRHAFEIAGRLALSLDSVIYQYVLTTEVVAQLLGDVEQIHGVDEDQMVWMCQHVTANVVDRLSEFIFSKPPTFFSRLISQSLLTDCYDEEPNTEEALLEPSDVSEDEFELVNVYDLPVEELLEALAAKPEVVTLITFTEDDLAVALDTLGFATSDDNIAIARERVQQSIGNPAAFRDLHVSAIIDGIPAKQLTKAGSSQTGLAHAIRNLIPFRRAS